MLIVKYNAVMKTIINCIICGGKLQGRQKMYCCIHCKNSAHQSYLSQQARGHKRKIEIVYGMGGRCEMCGYKRNLSALTFHHIDPKMKNFKLDIRSLSNRKFSNIVDELKKCKLVCHNCHAEIHYPQHNLASNP